MNPDMIDAGLVGNPDGSHRLFSRMPASSLAWWSIGLTVAIFPLAWVLMTHLLPWALLDTAFAPVSLMLLIDAAAVTGLVAWRVRGDRSLLLLIALVVSIPLAIFATFMMAGEIIAPH